MSTKSNPVETSDQVPGLDAFGQVIAAVSDLKDRVAALESENERMKTAGQKEPYAGFLPHVVHVMRKHFWNDKPDPEPVPTE